MILTEADQTISNSFSDETSRGLPQKSHLYYARIAIFVPCEIAVKINYILRIYELLSKIGYVSVS